MSRELRLYALVNALYLRPVQHGIQALHAVGDLFVKYRARHEAESIVLHQWAQVDKTVIVLDGGNVEALNDKFIKFQCLERKLSFPLPFASFNEDEASLGGVTTCVAAVIPEEIYGAVNSYKAADYEKARKIDYNGLGLIDGTEDTRFFLFKELVDGTQKMVKIYPQGTPEWELISMIKSCPLAR